MGYEEEEEEKRKKRRGGRRKGKCKSTGVVSAARG
jgi:hypothetical protein